MNPLIVSTCPVLDHQRWAPELEMFRLCYDLTASDYGVRYERRAFPCEGGVGDQPSKMMGALTVIANTSNEVMAELSKRGRPEHLNSDLSEESHR